MKLELTVKEVATLETLKITVNGRPYSFVPSVAKKQAKTTAESDTAEEMEDQNEEEQTSCPFFPSAAATTAKAYTAEETEAEMEDQTEEEHTSCPSFFPSAAKKPASTTANSYTAEETEEEMEDEEDQIGHFRVPHPYPSAIKRKLRSSVPMVTKKFTLHHDGGVEHDVSIDLTGRYTLGTSQPFGDWNGERSLPSGGIAHYAFRFHEKSLKNKVEMTCTKSGSIFYSDFYVKEGHIFFIGTLSERLGPDMERPLLKFTADKYHHFDELNKLSAVAKADLIEAAMLEEEA